MTTSAAPTEQYALTDLQKSMVLSSLRAPRSGVYVVQDVCESRDILDAALLRRAWQSVAERHPALRTHIEIGSDGDIRQSVAAHVNPEWRELDWTGVADVDFRG